MIQPAAAIRRRWRAASSVTIENRASRQKPNSTAASMTAGTNHSVTLSTTAWIGSLAPCAASTMRTIRASTESATMRTGILAESPARNRPRVGLRPSVSA